MNENFNTFRQQVLGMDTDLKLQLEHDILAITGNFDQRSDFNTAYSRLGYTVELIGIEIAQVALVEMYNRSKSLEHIANVFNVSSNSDYVNFIDQRITWSETKYPRYYQRSSKFWQELHILFREKTDGLDFESVDECKGISIREVLMHNIEVIIEKKPKHLKAWN